jgi:hypothetical protein
MEGYEYINYKIKHSNILHSSMAEDPNAEKKAKPMTL